MKTPKQVITQVSLAVATAATLLGFDCGVTILSYDSQQFAVCKDGIGTCSYIKYTPTCTYCGITIPINPNDACQQDGSYEIETQLMIYGNCSNGVCGAGRPDGMPGTKTCYYCSDEYNCGS